MAAELFEEVFGVVLPSHAVVQVAESGTPDARALTYQADLVLAFRRGGRTAFALIVEVQLQVDARKKRTWPHYLTAVGAELDCPAMVLVVTPDAKVQEWAAEPIQVGVGQNVITPFVLGPAAIPWPADDEAMAHPELAVLSAIAHRDDAGGLAAAHAALVAVACLDEDMAKTYTNFVLGALSRAARGEMERRMREDPQYQGVDYVQQWIDSGRVHAQGEAVLAILQARGLEPDEDQRARILDCRDEATLTAWIAVAAKAERLEDIFSQD